MDKYLANMSSKSLMEPLLCDGPVTTNVLSTVDFKTSREENSTVAQVHGTSWISSMIIIIANVLGIGVLGLAHAYAVLGWVWGNLVLFLALCSSAYSGLLISRIKQVVPSATIYADLGYAAYGNLGHVSVTVFAYTFIIGICFSFQLCASLALKALADLCFVYCSLLVALVVLPLAQYRNFEDMTVLIYIGAMAIIVPIGIILTQAFEDSSMYDDHEMRSSPDRVHHSLYDQSSTSLTIVACMDVLFATTGQVIFVEIMSEMKNPHEFSKSILGASAIFCMVYFVMATVGYYFYGSLVLNPITNNLPNKTAQRWCNAFVLVHIIIAYVLQIVVLARGFEHLVMETPSEEQPPNKHKSQSLKSQQMIWFLFTLIIVLVSFMVCNLTPFINSLMGFVASTAGIATAFIFPFLFAAKLLPDMSPRQRHVHQAFALFAVSIAVLGVYMSIRQMQESFAIKIPFAC